ncbi:hypothetical protein [Longimicrobium sp.]|uniref:hypothetical protein n=1 Tax=Longimicrobium sp. TaxID=2029185 RepID=UPI002E380046|nr:hypothetical protein [Longimicrobium sp.]HEX6039434.1 hypothetical protein [Longimicrobium sp.]
MRKLRLDPETLSVETFRTERAQPSAQGTIRACQEQTTVFGATACGLCVPQSSQCDPSQDKTWCVCVSQYDCTID